MVADKTGTLTMNELILREIYTDNRLIKISYMPITKRGNNKSSKTEAMAVESIVTLRDQISRSSDSKNLFYCMTLCHTAIV